jgi:nucleoside-diphosphate-sugar epimerase
MTAIALVTGGAGFIGSHLVRALQAQSRRVRILDDLSTGSRECVPSGTEFVQGDIRDPVACRQACTGVDTVFHLAARVTVRHSAATFVEDADTNVLGTLRMLEAAASRGARRFIYASSMAVYADSAPGRQISEEYRTEPISAYGLGKLAAEQYVLLMGKHLGLEPVVLRFFNTFGPGQGYTPYVGVVTIFITHILAGKTCTIYDDGQQCRDFTHVRDVVAACLLAERSPAAVGEVFNIGTAVGTSVNRLAALLRGLLGAGSFDHQPRDASELRYSVANIAKARHLLSYEPRVGLAEGLPEVIEQVRARIASPAL